MNDKRRISGYLIRESFDAFVGYAFDPQDCNRRFAVEYLVDGIPVGVTMANRFNEALSKDGVGDGCYGFAFVLRPSLVESAKVVEVRVANVGAIVGAPVELAQTASRTADGAAQGEVSWNGGLRLSGWLRTNDASAVRVRALVDGETVAESWANHWRHVSEPRPMAVRGFDFHLPARFANGQVWRVNVVNDEGQELIGSPVTLVAFEKGLEACLQSLGRSPAERFQGRIYDRFVPQSLPFSCYERWKIEFPCPAPNGSDSDFGVVLLDGPQLEKQLQSLEMQKQGRWIACALATRDGFTFDAAELEAFLADTAPDLDYFIFALPGVVFESDALSRIAECFAAHPDAPLIYADIDLVGLDESLWPLALPAFDYERLLEQGYLSAAFAIRRATVATAIEKHASSFFRVANSVFDSFSAAAKVLHLPCSIARAPQTVFAGSQEALREATQAHLEARDLTATVENAIGKLHPACRVARRHARAPKVSILIPTRNQVNLLRPCLESIYAAASRVRAEIIVVDNDSTEPATLQYLQTIARDGVRILRALGPFNFSRLNNLAAQEAQGDFLCFLNNETEALSNQWLEEMLSRHADESVGAVGAKLLWPSNVVQHGGVVLGVNFSATHAFVDRIAEDPGYSDLLKVAHECSAVTAACMTTPRKRFLALGGFDELLFPVNFNDVDYCLKLRAEGLRIVFTPHAQLIHKESASRGRDERPDAASRFAREMRSLREKWGPALTEDCYYNPNLGLDDPPFASLAWPPRRRSARTNALPAPRAVIPGM